MNLMIVYEKHLNVSQKLTLRKDKDANWRALY